MFEELRTLWLAESSLLISDKARVLRHARAALLCARKSWDILREIIIKTIKKDVIPSIFTIILNMKGKFGD